MKDHSRGLGRRTPSSSLCSSRPGNDDEAGHTHSFKSPVSVTPRLEVWCGLEKLEEFPLEKAVELKAPTWVSRCL